VAAAFWGTAGINRRCAGTTTEGRKESRTVLDFLRKGDVLMITRIDRLASTLWASVPVLLAYVLSYVNVGIFWANHHHMLHAATHIDGRVLWANMFLLFWLSLVPFVIRWIDEAGFAALPVAAYGFVLAMSAVGYTQLQFALVACNGRNSALAVAVGHDLKGKLSLATYAACLPLAFLSTYLSIALYVLVACMWLVPDRRTESTIKK
jgi:uncharacterized membrane protein